MLTTAVFLLATMLTIVRAWPQTSRIAVHRNTTGVSAVTWSLMLAAHLSWIVWTARLGVVTVLLANVLAAAGCVAVLLTISRHGGLPRWRPVAASAAAVAASSLLLWLGGSAVLSGALTMLTAVMVIPQVVKVYRTDGAGVSAVTWLLSVASSITWPVYYLLIDRPVLIAPNAAILVSASLILGRIGVVRCRARASEPVDALAG